MESFAKVSVSVLCCGDTRCDRVGCRPCPSSILGGPRVLRLRDDCSEIMDCDGITMIALGGISLGLVVGWVEEMAG